jgi:alkylhydroperoxidase family enzyme
MPRIPYADPQTYSETAKQAVARSSINLQRMMAGLSDNVLAGVGPFLSSFYNNSSLPAPLREIAILTVGTRSNSSYEVMQHKPLAKLVGLTDGQISAVEHGGQHPGVLDARQQAVLDFTDELIAKVKVTDATLARARGQLSDRQILDLIMLVGGYMMVARLLETTGVEHDATPIDWKNQVPNAVK